MRNLHAKLQAFHPDPMSMKEEDHWLTVRRGGPVDGGADSFSVRQRFRTREHHPRAADIDGFSFTAERNDLTRADQEPDRELHWVARMGPAFLRQIFECPSGHLSVFSQQLRSQRQVSVRNPGLWRITLFDCNKKAVWFGGYPNSGPGPEERQLGLKSRKIKVNTHVVPQQGGIPAGPGQSIGAVGGKKGQFL